MKVFIHTSSERCDICNRYEGDVYDNEVISDRGIQVIRFFAHKSCKSEMFAGLNSNLREK